MARGAQRGRAAALVVAAVLPLVALAAGEGANSADAVVDEETAEKYNEFVRQAVRHTARLAERMGKRYRLDEGQQAEVKEILAEVAESFLSRHGRELFDLMQRGRAVGELMRQEQMAWDELPPDIRQDLARRAIGMMQLTQEQMQAVADRVAHSLNDEQRERLSQERRRMEQRFGQGIAMIRVMGGLDESGPVGAGGAASQPAKPRPPRLPGLSARAEDRWERYVKRFIRRHRLDEVQKLQAMDLLAKYKQQLQVVRGQLAAQAATRPAESQPASRPAGEGIAAGDFHRRLQGMRNRRRPIRELFEGLRKDLETIPTPVQRQLAEQRESTAPGPRTRRAAGPVGGTDRRREEAP